MESERKQNKILYRSSSNYFLTGVCAGFSEYFHIDIAFIRFIFIVLTFLNLSSFILYILFSAILPRQKVDFKEKNEDGNTVAIFASVFLIIAAVLFINHFKIPLFINLWSISFVFSLAILLLGIGISLSYLLYVKVELKRNLYRLRRRRTDRLISGLLSGVAHFFEIDCNLLRAAIVSISVFLIKLLPLFIILYFLLTILISYEKLETLK